MIHGTVYTASSAFRWALSPGIDWNVPLVSPSSFQKKRAAPVAGFTPQATRILSSCPECSGLKLSDHPSPPHDSLPPKQKKCSPHATGITHESYTLYCYHTKIGPKFQTFFEQKLPRFSPPSFVKILQNWLILRPTGAEQTNSRDGEGRPCCSCILTRFGPRASRSLLECLVHGQSVPEGRQHQYKTLLHSSPPLSCFANCAVFRPFWLL